MKGKNPQQPQGPRAGGSGVCVGDQEECAVGSSPVTSPHPQAKIPPSPAGQGVSGAGKAAI